MRRVLLLLGLAGLVVAAIAATASAQRVTKLSAVAVQTSGHRSGHSFLNRGRLAEPGNLSERVGRFHAKFSPRGHHRVRIRGVAVFRGEGSLKVKGTEGPGDKRILVIGGTGAFNGAAGKLKTRSLSQKNTLLTFLFVQ